MVKCEICGKEYSSFLGLGKHVRYDGISSQEYYDKFLLLDESEKVCKICGEPTKFRSLKDGYDTYCSLSCHKNDPEFKQNASDVSKKLWKNKEYRENMSKKVSKTVKSLWEDENSIFNKKEYREKLRNGQLKRYEKFRTDFVNKIEEISNLLLFDDEYIHAHYHHNWKCKICGKEFKQSWNEIQQGYKCPGCFPRSQGYSKYELEINDFICTDLGFESITKSKQIIPPKELDIYIPDKMIAVEFDGLYWHSDDRGTDKDYHLNKTNECEEKGIRLIHIFEDEWLNKKNLVKERLKSILSVNHNKQRIHARNCEIKEIDSKTKNNFLEQFHLQGKDSSTIKLGAFCNNELISVMTFSKSNISKNFYGKDGIWEMSRYATNYNYHIPGIASKLLTYFKRNFEWKEIFTFADKRWSVGNLYYKTNFEFLYDTKPSYWYILGYERIHRFNLRKTNNDPKDISETELRKKEGYSKIWDCGNMKFSTKHI